MKITLLTGKTFDISAEVGMDIKVVPSHSLRKLTLRIDNKERIPVLSVPKFCSRKRAIDFVNNNLEWIVKNLQKLPPQKSFENGEAILLFGEKLTIFHNPAARCGVRKEGEKLIVSGGAEFLHRRIKDYVRKRAEHEFYARSAKLAAKIDCKIKGVSIKDTKSRWGSCSSLNHINYSWRIALAPSFVIDYMMAHEVSHLKHRDHSRQFWLCVENLCPDWKIGHDWLRNNGKQLYIYR